MVRRRGNGGPARRGFKRHDAHRRTSTRLEGPRISRNRLTSGITVQGLPNRLFQHDQRFSALFPSFGPHVEVRYLCEFPCPRMDTIGDPRITVRRHTRAGHHQSAVGLENAQQRKVLNEDLKDLQVAEVSPSRWLNRSTFRRKKPALGCEKAELRSPI